MFALETTAISDYFYSIRGAFEIKFRQIDAGDEDILVRRITCFFLESAREIKRA